MQAFRRYGIGALAAGFAARAQRDLLSSAYRGVKGYFTKSRPPNAGRKRNNVPYGAAYKRSTNYSIKRRRYARDSMSKPAFGFYKRPVLGNTQVTKLKTGETFQFNDTTPLGTKVYTFRPNSLYIPFGSESAQQPCGFDELSQLWSSYVVSGGMYRIRIFNYSAANPLRVYSLCTADTAPTSSQGYACQGDVVTTHIPPLTSRNILVKFNSANLVGKSVDNDSQFAANVTGSPSFQTKCYVAIFCKDSAATAAACSHEMEVEIIQNAKFYAHFTNQDE